MISYKLKHISFDIEGDSHSEKIILKIRGLKKDSIFDVDFIKEKLKLRNPKNFYNTQRNEIDEFTIISPITEDEMIVEFKNVDINKEAYIKNKGYLRPSQSDYAQYLKTKDIKSGGSTYSGRMTLPLTFIGAIAELNLIPYNIEICSRIIKAGSFVDDEIKDDNEIKELYSPLPCVNKEGLENLLDKTVLNKDSVGGMIETYVFNPFKGLGGPMNEGLESIISYLLFSIPAVKAVSFGDGEKFATSYGSQVQDEFIKENNTITTKQNHNGGIIGGVTTGTTIKIYTTIKPTPTLSQPQKSLNIISGKEEEILFGGRHDSFIVNRAIWPVEGMISLVLLDEIYEEI